MLIFYKSEKLQHFQWHYTKVKEPRFLDFICIPCIILKHRTSFSNSIYTWTSAESVANALYLALRPGTVVHTVFHDTTNSGRVKT